jgi:putative transposase
MRFDFIGQARQEQPHWNLRLLCRVLEVSCSGYAAWRKRQRQSPSPRQQAQARLVVQIRAAPRRGRGYYGSPMVHRDLREQGVHVSRKRVARLMRQQGLRGRCRGRRAVRTTDSRHALPVAPNLLARRFAPQEIGRLNRFWCGDITYVPTVEGWQYLATVQDLFSRRIIGWAMSDTLESRLVEQAWHKALKSRGFIEGQGPLIYHSDRGSQYASHLFQEALRRAGTWCSMSEKGDCYDNAVAESFFGTYKAELLADQPQGRFRSKAQAWALTADYIDNFYNRVRRHSTLDYKSPIAFELAQQVK